jgi:hypothetical protein
MSNVTDLGPAARTGTLYVTDKVISPSFTSPDIQLASGVITSAYVAGFNKYVFYYPLTSGTAVLQGFSVTGLPANFFDTHSVSVDWVGSSTSTWSVIPVLDVSPNGYNMASAGGYFTAYLQSRVSGTFSGTAYLKVVVQFTSD